jgi:hypothetical protein
LTLTLKMEGELERMFLISVRNFSIQQTVTALLSFPFRSLSILLAARSPL